MLDPEFFLRCLAPAGAVAIGTAIGSFLNGCIYRIPNGLGEVRWEDLWKLVLCCLGAILILGSGYARSFGKWSRSTVIFSAALAGGWLGALAAATMFISVQKGSPDTEDAILLACVSVGPLFS